MEGGSKREEYGTMRHRRVTDSHVILVESVEATSTLIGDGWYLEDYIPDGRLWQSPC